jgi:hypothetical protein
MVIKEVRRALYASKQAWGHERMLPPARRSKCFLKGLMLYNMTIENQEEGFGSAYLCRCGFSRH